jgi:hypothetical protein
MRVSIHKTNLLKLQTHFKIRSFTTTTTTTTTCFGETVLNSVYEIPDDGTDVSKHVGVLKDHIFRIVCNLCIKLDLQMNINF